MGRKSKFSQEQKVEIYRRYLDINCKMKLELRNWDKGGMPLLFHYYIGFCNYFIHIIYKIDFLHVILYLSKNACNLSISSMLTFFFSK